MTITYDTAKAADIDEIMFIENHDFSVAEAASRESMIQRIKLISDTFLVARNEEQKVVGYIVGPAFTERYLTDELFEHSRANLPTDKAQTVVSLAIHPDYQKMGIGTVLLDNLAAIAKAQGRDLISLTCLEQLVPYYEAHGYVNEGVSASQHAGETWYNMVLELQ